MPNKEPEQVDLTHERMVCYYSDIYKDNFPVDINNQLWVIDFDQAGVLPVSFMSFTLERPLKDPLPWEYRKTIPIEQTENLKEMHTAAWWFRIGCGYGCGCSSSGFVSGSVLCSLLTDC
jgi:hypothetical protein